MLATVGLALAPAAGATERSHPASDCPLPPHAAVVHVGLAHALPALATVAPAAPAPAEAREIVRPDALASSDVPTAVSARAPPDRFDA